MESNLVKIENTSFVRDMDSKAILPTNRRDLSEYQEKRRRAMLEQQHRESITDEINIMKNQIAELLTIKDDFQEIKDLLKKLKE